MIHRNLRFVLAVIICKLAFVSIVDADLLPNLKSTFSNYPSQVSPVPVSDEPRVQLSLLSEEVLQSAELFLRQAFQGKVRCCDTCHTAAENRAVAPLSTAILPGEDPLFAKKYPIGMGLGNDSKTYGLPSQAHSQEPNQKGEIQDEKIPKHLHCRARHRT